MFTPARLPIDDVPTSDRCPDRPIAVRVAVLRSGNPAAFCVVQNITRRYVQVELFSAVVEDAQVSLHAGDRWVVSGTVASFKKGVARIELGSPLDADAFMALSALNDPDRRRSLPRVEGAAHVRLRVNRRTIAARLRNISATGARISAGMPFLPATPVVLTLPDFGDLRGFICWSNTREAGLRFDTPIAVDALAKWLSSRTRVWYRD